MIARLGLVLLFAATSAFGALSETEERIVAAVRERSEAAIDLLERAVGINSGTMNHEGVREVGRLFAAELESLGFSTRWVELPPENQRAGHLVATREGTQGKRVLLLGHLDTVFEKQSPFQPWDRHGDRVRGQGVTDMKGGDVAMIEALRALHRLGLLDDTRVTIVLTGDEERVGPPREVSRRELVEAAKRSDAALSFESVNRQRGQDMASIARRGTGGWVLRVSAIPGHSSGMFSDRSAGYGAIYEGARILNTFREQVAEPGLSFSPGVMLGGTVVDYDQTLGSGTAFGKANVIPRAFVVQSDMRFLTNEQAERARAKMRDIVAQSLRGTRAEIRFNTGYPPMAETPGNRRLLELYSMASSDAGLGPIGAMDPDERGAGDIQYAAPHVDSIDGLGVYGRGSHTASEELEIPSLERSALRAAIFIYRLTRP